MNVLEKAKILGDAGKYDVCGGKLCPNPKIEKGLKNMPGVVRVKGKVSCSMLKVLQTNACSFDCKYCSNRAGCEKKVAKLKPEELANLFVKLKEKNIVDALFLSSGITKDPDFTTEKMLETAKLVRYKHKFRGYMHFKIIPGTNRDLIKQASYLADRLSVNIEAPSKGHLSELSSVKEFRTDILRRQAWIKQQNPRAGQSTQIIVGAGDETDLEVLKIANWEYKNLDLQRCYYSSFRPVKGTPLEKNKGEKQSRANHLYNADFLIREYGYKLKEFKEAMPEDMLPEKDPKLAIAEATITDPINVEDASYEELIRVPGIGIPTAKNIIKRREEKKIDSKFIKQSSIIMKRAAPFIRVNGESQKRLSGFL
jgi:predicted DNA-binding helix-hairpin-helix protein